MNFHKKTLLASLLLLSSATALADSAELLVIGSIEPTACTPSFVGGGTVDYGSIPTQSLSATEPTTLPEKTISYLITCDDPISIGYSFIDNRDGTDIPVPGYIAANGFGLGMQGTSKIGAYVITPDITGILGDGDPAIMIHTNHDWANGSWVVTSAVSAEMTDNFRMRSFTAPGETEPGAYSTVSGSLKIVTTIAPTKDLDLTETVDLNGLATMNVRYP